MRRLVPLVPLGVATVLVAWALDAAGLPSAFLFAALVVGVAVALTRPDHEHPPPLAFSAAQAVTGVTLGAYVQSSALSSLADDWLPVALVSAGTLAASIGAGLVLSRWTSVDRPTATLGLIAGGASGIVAMADELGADDRLVAFMQYLRVLVVVVVTPILIAAAFPSAHGAPALAGSEPVLGEPRAWLLTGGIAVAGVLGARLTRLPAASLLGPMLLAAVVVLAVPGGEFAVPPLLRESAFALIGLQVGLRFTLDTLREIGSLLVPSLVAIGALLTVSFAFAVGLQLTTAVTLLDAYLATTPGGLYAVLAVAVGAGADTTFILAVQTLRVLVMVLLAPLVVRRITRSARLRA